jgi:drug/metabolite transporter (DMT)-like permease
MNWQSLILAQAILAALATITTRLLARNKNTRDAGLAITAGWFIFLYLCGLLMLPFFGDVHYRSLTEFWWRLLGGGAAFALTNAFTYYSFVYLEAAIGTILGTISALFTVILAALTIHEDLTVRQVVGAVLLIAAIIYTISATRHKPTRAVQRNLISGLFFVFLAAIFFAIAAVNEKYLLGHLTVGDYLLYGWFGQMAMAVMLAALIQPDSFKLFKDRAVLGWTLSLGGIRAVSGLCFLLAMIRSNNVALITVISNLKLIIVVLLGIWILKERNRIRQKIAGAAFAILALAFMFW